MVVRIVQKRCAGIDLLKKYDTNKGFDKYRNNDFKIDCHQDL